MMHDRPSVVKCDDIDRLIAEAAAPRLAVEAALARGCRRFVDTSRPAFTMTVSPSARPDCPTGHVQLTRWDGLEPTGHTYASAADGWSTVAYEVRMQGYGAPCDDTPTTPHPIGPLPPLPPREVR